MTTKEILSKLGFKVLRYNKNKTVLFIATSLWEYNSEDPESDFEGDKLVVYVEINKEGSITAVKVSENLCDPDNAVNLPIYDLVSLLSLLRSVGLDENVDGLIEKFKESDECKDYRHIAISLYEMGFIPKNRMIAIGEENLFIKVSDNHKYIKVATDFKNTFEVYSGEIDENNNPKPDESHLDKINNIDELKRYIDLLI